MKTTWTTRVMKLKTYRILHQSQIQPRPLGHNLKATHWSRFKTRPHSRLPMAPSSTQQSISQATSPKSRVKTLCNRPDSYRYNQTSRSRVKEWFKSLVMQVCTGSTLTKQESRRERNSLMWMKKITEARICPFNLTVLMYFTFEI